jgi:deoxycytidylate deaminase
MDAPQQFIHTPEAAMSHGMITSIQCYQTRAAKGTRLGEVRRSERSMGSRTKKSGMGSQTTNQRTGTTRPEGEWQDGELVVGLVFPVGVNYQHVIDALERRLEVFGYRVEIIKISTAVIPKLVPVKEHKNAVERINKLQDAGNSARDYAKDNSVLAKGAVSLIGTKRFNAAKKEEIEASGQARKRIAYIISSLKRPEEVQLLRAVYGQGFYLIGIHQDDEERINYLRQRTQITRSEAEAVVERDADEKNSEHGQRVTDTFHLSDVFLTVGRETSALEEDVWRVLDTMFAYPHMTPSFDEYSMYMAYASSLRSADLSRQVGAVIAQGQDLVATGANDAPKFKGGHYWAKDYSKPGVPLDELDGRDYVRGYDSNKRELLKLLDEIESLILNGDDGRGLESFGKDLATIFKDVKLTEDRSEAGQSDHDAEDKKRVLADSVLAALGKRLTDYLPTSSLKDITEYGRMVHAEMDALLCCARINVSTMGATMYCTTFPCHNCAKHIVSAGIRRVVYIEPYEKSKALELNNDTIVKGLASDRGKQEKVSFEPFIGIGPRRFFDLYSMKLGSGKATARKDAKGYALFWDSKNREADWDRKSAQLKIQMLPMSYLENEWNIGSAYKKSRSLIKKELANDDQCAKGGRKEGPQKGGERKNKGRQQAGTKARHNGDKKATTRKRGKSRGK